MCAFHERVNMQEEIVRRAGLEMEGREEELRYLRMEVRGGGRDGGKERGREGEGEELQNICMMSQFVTSSHGQ